MKITNVIHLRNLQGDIFGCITAAVIALPMALTFGVVTGAGASAGLWGAILIGFFAALFGGVMNKLPYTQLCSQTSPE